MISVISVHIRSVYISNGPSADKYRNAGSPPWACKMDPVLMQARDLFTLPTNTFSIPWTPEYFADQSGPRITCNQMNWSATKQTGTNQSNQNFQNMTENEFCIYRSSINFSYVLYSILLTRLHHNKKNIYIAGTYTRRSSCYTTPLKRQNKNSRLFRDH